MKSPSQRLRGRGRGNLLNSVALMWSSGPGIPFMGMCVAAGPAAARPACPSAPSQQLPACGINPATALVATVTRSRKIPGAQFSATAMGN